MADLNEELLAGLTEEVAEESIDDMLLQAAVPPPPARRPEARKQESAPSLPRPSTTPAATSSAKPKPKLKGSTTTANAATTSAKPTPPRPSLPPTLPAARAPVAVTGAGKGKTAQPAHDVEEEELEFGQPARQTKRPRANPPTRPAPSPLPSQASSSGGLALPGMGGPSALAPTLPGPPPAATLDDEDEDDEWDEIAGVRPASAAADDASIFGDTLGADEEVLDNDMDELGLELEAQLAQAMDGLEEDAEEDGTGSEVVYGGEVSTDGVARPRPISLNQFAGGALEQDDDDYSSSEDSDDD